MPTTTPDANAVTDEKATRVIEQIVELQREFYFEKKGKDSERRRKLREIIERVIPSGDN